MLYGKTILPMQTSTTYPSAWVLSPTWSFNEAASLGEAALAYARVGAPVFPLEPRGKIPLVPRGFYAATCDPEVIRHWWRRWPKANVGMPTGKQSGCWVLDVDPRHGGLDSLKRIQQDALLSWDHLPETGLLEATRLQLTGGGGVHLCYQARRLDGVHLSNAASFAGYAGIDLRVDGGYIVVAPSQHTSGSVYRWGNDLPLLPFPDLLVERWRAHRQRAFARSSSDEPYSYTSHSHSHSHARTDASSREADNRQCDPEYWLRCALSHAVPGCRRRYAMFLACHLLDEVGMTPDVAKRYLVTYASRVSQDDHPFPVAQALECLDWAVYKRFSCRVG